MITTRRSASVGDYLSWPFRFICVLLWYIKEVIVANWAVIADNLTPGLNAHSGIARVPTRCESELEVTLLSSMITITPGTLTLGTTIDVHGVRWIYVHSLYDGDADAIREGSWDMEEHMLHAKRPEGFDHPRPEHPRSGPELYKELFDPEVQAGERALAEDTEAEQDGR
ncbi:Na+/H+ antiporter subunit E [Auritidibacter ignavus]|uniref:Na+/H+ antiporter subunit E n=1 Tax=Auritidibacter ignavus TaxID=678932 RepID=UPI00244AB220|nr:Na+/H+ antiporter subunit E [Auritidibacter ignavus]WGH84313.1 Na+/H+ antiporter subunit E [Auritidibacter ignavus]